ncbi:MAG: ECF RNA polymerase sigma factor SigW [Planctomycetes bacterium]|nr:ECF RNA polymerase sigma factor SigW [Planctomycetota bacterium]
MARQPDRNPDPPARVPSDVAQSLDARTRERGLVAAFRAGDAGAFEEIVRMHRQRLFTIALRRTGNATVAEDAVQVALAKAWRHIPKMTAELDLSAWLSSVVQNAALDQIRGDERQKRLAQSVWDASPDRAERRSDQPTARASSAEAGSDAPAAQAELGAILLEGIAALPEPYRVALDLYHVQGMSVDEIGKTLDLNENTVKSHLARGRTLLRSRIGARLERGGWL